MLLLVALFSNAGLARSAEEEVRDDESPEARAQQFQALADDVAGLEKQSNVLKKVVRLVRPTVVHIEAETVDPESQRRGRRGHIEEAGSGFIILQGQNYYVVTNYHVVKQAALRDIKIRLADGRQIHPLKVLSDPETDVAVMAVSAPNLVASRLGNSDDIEIGDFVLAIGSPFGLSHSVTFGIISAESRHDLELGSDVKYQDFLQTDTAINPGNSGGPLINLRGEVIGMNTAIASSSGANEGIGFTIPIKLVRTISHQLVEHGRVVRGRLGIGLDKTYGVTGTATPVGLQQVPHGARISDVQPGTPAEAADLQPGDIILTFDGVPVENNQHLVNLVGPTEIGRDVPVTISRAGRKLNLNVRVGPAPSVRAAPGK
ncbi:MAG TPA: trypsin-like peptidase domain-containing protein [Pirellulales bacterium]|nr:trypsin-like peptidase domain-containing protein [Pirellulales bacterium]